MSERLLPDLGIEPLTARSLALSALLGTHPPRLPVRALVALGALFDISEGTMRTALSRMVAAGELESDGGRYALGTRMRHRQAVQDAGRNPAADAWDGSWWLVLVDAARRPVGERRSFRNRMRDSRMGELHPGLWLRPANIDGPAPEAGALVVHGTIGDRDPTELAGQLWDLPAIAETGRRLGRLVDDATRWLAPGDPAALVDTFLVSVAAVRFLLAEPRLPAALVGPDWPPDALRSGYDRLEAAHRRLLSSFLAEASRSTVPTEPYNP